MTRPLPDRHILALSEEQDLAHIDQFMTDRGALPTTWSASIAKKFSYSAREDLGDFYESKGAKLC